eukprot:4212774-Amphidinium_carterae.2
MLLDALLLECNIVKRVAYEFLKHVYGNVTDESAKLRSVQVTDQEFHFPLRCATVAGQPKCPTLQKCSGKCFSVLPPEP